MRFVFMRHGHYDKAGLDSKARDRARLSPQGVAQVEAAAAWLGLHGVEPDRVLVNGKTRVRHSAEIILRTLGCTVTPTQPRSTSLRFPDVEARVQEWMDELGLTDDATLLVVASGQQMHAIIRTFGAAPYEGKGHAYTVICERNGAGKWAISQPPPAGSPPREG